VPAQVTLNPFHVYVDWDKNGNYTGTWDDVTPYVRGGISLSYGRESVTSLSPMIGGRGSFMLDNRSRRYSPRNASSPLFGKLKPARPVKITRDVTVSGVTTTYTLFVGHTDDSPISPDANGKMVQFNLVDSLQDFQQNTVATVLWQGLRTGAAIGKILDAAGWTGGRDLDNGATVIPWWWADGETASDALQRVLQSEGFPSLLTIGSAGEIVYRDRTHRKIRTASRTPQAVLSGTGKSEPVMGNDFQYSDAWQNIVNDVLIDVDEHAPSAGYTAVWSTDETITILPGGSTTVQVKATDPFYGAITPTFKDYEVISGAVTSTSISQTSGTSTTITYSAAVATSITNVQLRAVTVPVGRTYQVTASDTASQTDYGQRGMPSSAGPEWANRYDVQGIADMYIAQRAQPLPTVQVSFPCHYTQTARLSKLLSLDLSDRVTVIEPETGLSNDFYVETISHEITDITSHVITLGLEMVPAVGSGPVFTIGTSTLNGTDPLAY
jgi:hypothetical protein